MNTDNCRRFTGRVALITAGGSGIGRACARRLAAKGAEAAISDLNVQTAREIIADLPQGHHFAVEMDVTDPAAVESAIEAVTTHFGRLDVLINVAGGDTAHPDFERTDDFVWQKMFELNLLSAVRCCRAAIPYLRASSEEPAIVMISSINAYLSFGSEPYSSAKAGLTALTRNLAASLASDGIRVNTVAPATIRTAVWDDQPGGADRLAPLYPLGRVGEPEDIAAAVAFLASADAAWITGHTLPVDGGLLSASRIPH